MCQVSLLPPRPCGDNTPLCSHPAWVAALFKSIAGKSPGLNFLLLSTLSLSKRFSYSFSQLSGAVHFPLPSEHCCQPAVLLLPTPSACSCHHPHTRCHSGAALWNTLQTMSCSHGHGQDSFPAALEQGALPMQGPQLGHGDLHCSKACKQPVRLLVSPLYLCADVTHGERGCGGETQPHWYS